MGKKIRAESLLSVVPAGPGPSAFILNSLWPLLLSHHYLQIRYQTPSYISTDLLLLFVKEKAHWCDNIFLLWLDNTGQNGDPPHSTALALTGSWFPVQYFNRLTCKGKKKKDSYPVKWKLNDLKSSSVCVREGREAGGWDGRFHLSGQG